MPYNWWEVAPLAGAEEPKRPDLDWDEVPELDQIRGMEPQFVSYTERLYATTRQVFQQEKEDDNDAWGFVKDIGGGLKKGLGWTADKLADYNRRFVSPTAAWMYGGVRGGVEAPNPLAAWAGSAKDMEKAEEVLGKLHPMARLALELTADPLLWGTLPLTMGGGALLKATTASAQLARAAGAGASAGQKAALFLNNVGRTANLVGHVPDRLMMAAIRPAGVAVSKVPLLPVSAIEEGRKVMRLAPLGGLAKTTRLGRTHRDLHSTLGALGTQFMEEGEQRLAVRRALSHIADDTLEQTLGDSRKFLLAEQRDMVGDLTRYSKDLKLGNYIDRLGSLDDDIIGVGNEIAMDLRNLRARDWKLPAAAMGTELRQVGSQANRIYRSAMMTWVWGVLWTSNYMCQNMLTDLFVAGPSALYWGVKSRIGKRIMSHIPYELQVGEAAQRSAGVMRSTHLRGGTGEALVREMADAHAVNPAALTGGAPTEGLTSFIVYPGQRSEGGVVDAAAKLAKATDAQGKAAQSLLGKSLNTVAKGVERAASAPMKWAQWWDSTIWNGCVERHLVRTLRESAAQNPNMGRLAAKIASIERHPEFRALPNELRQSLLMAWERKAWPEEVLNTTFDLLEMAPEFVQFAAVPSTLPWAPAITESMNGIIRDLVSVPMGQRVIGKEMRHKGLDLFMRKGLLSDVAVPIARDQADMQAAFIVDVARNRGFSEAQVKVVKDTVDNWLGSLRGDLDGTLAQVGKEGGLTATEAKYELVKHLRGGTTHTTLARHMAELVSNEALGPEEVIRQFGRMRMAAQAAKTQTRLFVNELESHTFRVRDLIRVGSPDAEDAWRALADNPNFGMAADMGPFDLADVEGLKDRLFKAMSRGVDRQWTLMNRRAFEEMGISKAAEIAVEGYFPEMVNSLHNSLKGLWSERMNVLSQFQSGQAQSTAMRFAREVTDEMRALGTDGLKQVAVLRRKATDEAVSSANAIMGNFFSGVTNFDELARHVFPFVRWSTRAPAIVSRYLGRNPWFLPAVSRWVTETEKENLPYFGAWMPLGYVPLVGNILAEPARQFAPYQMIRPIVGGPEIFGRSELQQALSTLGIAGFFPGPLPQAAAGRFAGQPTSPTGEFFPWQRGVTQPLMVAGEELSALAEGVPVAEEAMATAAAALRVPEDVLGTLSELAYGKVSQDIFHRDVHRELVNRGQDITEVEEGSPEWRAAARMAMTRRAIRFLLPMIRPISEEQLAYTQKQAKAFMDVGISQAEQIAIRRKGKSPWDLLNKEQSAQVAKLIGEDEMRRRAKVVPLGLTEGEAKTWSVVQSARALIQLKYADTHDKLAELGLVMHEGKITGREYRVQRSELKGNNYTEVLGVRQQAVAELLGTGFAGGLDENGIRREWDNLRESMQSSVSAAAPKALMPEDEALEGFQEIRAEQYLLPDGTIDWGAWRDAQAAYLASAPQYAEYILRYEDRFIEDLPMEQLYQQALDDMDEYSRIPKYIGVSPEQQWRISAVRTMVNAMQSVFSRMTLGERSLNGETAATILVKQGKISTQDYILYKMSRKNENPISDLYNDTHPLLALFGLTGQGEYLHDMAPLGEAVQAKAELLD